ncbi:Histone-lysine N-methyltransferase ASHR2 [Apostasia shenzhenica]|uniref:Histone-lysine N-methyltransferase ASHR2 n=1 Tax=Apostasia shenzhenica TaxID=1088818 RepID=A0A2I0AGX5_9ASPA|nr:Histone-lysine N-methyltransferase ASHR2 [Apostasia shenzhenica]
MGLSKKEKAMHHGQDEENIAHGEPAARKASLLFFSHTFFFFGAGGCRSATMSAATTLSESLVKLSTIPGRGRALVASRHIRPGEIILSDSPLLLYPAAFTPSPPTSFFCSYCFRSLLSVRLPCPTCSFAVFCSQYCLSAALTSSHSPSLCRSLDVLPRIRDTDLRALAVFLLAASNLSSTSPADFHRLLSLDGGDSSTAQAEAVVLHSLVAPLTGFSVDVTNALLAKDKRNAFGLMEPFRVEDAGERKVRAYGIYPNASLFNHDCLPNACRFDYLDREGNGNTDIMVRAIHDIPEGREVCLSYFPVKWGYKERQQRLTEDYGFRCSCDRCEVEKNWKDDAEESMEEEEEDEGVEAMEEEGGEVGGEENNDFPHAYFFVRYVCDQENCGGTMAPLPPQEKPSELMECNVCGRLRKQVDFVGEEGDVGNDIILDA